MKRNKLKMSCSGGFTLIELLVVVLIIGILAAVALPQYNKAVMKSRIAAYEVNMKAIWEAQTVCQLRKGSECTWDELDISQPECKPIPGIIDSCYYESTGNIGITGCAYGGLLYYPSGIRQTGQDTGPHTRDIYTSTDSLYCSTRCIAKCDSLGFKYQESIFGPYASRVPISKTQTTY